MPILKNAKKALRVSKRKTVINSRVKSRMKTLSDAFLANPTPATLAAAYSSIDIAAKGNILKKNKAARLKSQLSRFLAESATGEKKTVAKPKTAKKTVKKTVKKVAKKTSPKKK